MSAMLLLAAATAPDLTICADRPGRANATCTVPLGHWQLETGIADWTRDRTAGERQTLLAIGATAIKYGLTDRSHIELDVTPYLHSTTRSDGLHEAASGLGDIAVRYKHRLTADDAAVQVTAYPFIKIPTAKRPLGNRRLEGGFAVPIGYAIPNSALSLTLGPELDCLADDGGHGHHLAMVQVASAGWQATSRLSLSAEVWEQWNWDRPQTTRQASADGSIAYLVSNRAQLDVGANFGLNRDTADVELYAGASILF